jgi:predicted nucleic-acid-binding Zn-ribbon protein
LVAFSERLSVTKLLSDGRRSAGGMVHCPECDGEIAEESDVEFVDLDAKMAGIFRSSKRFYVVACNNCGAAIGSGVAGGGG